MPKAKRSIYILLCLVLIFVNLSPVSAGEGQIKNIIYMIPDGGGMAPFYLADFVKLSGGFEKYPNATPADAEEMYIKQYLAGSETTYSGNSKITDSAAAGTALSSGYKTNNGMIGITPDKKPHANILEVCQLLGMSTGIVVTYEWSNATPAAFSAHAESRNDTLLIAEQAVHQGIDVVFGKTLDEYIEQEWFSDDYLKSLGYNVIKSKDELEGISSGEKVWGKLPPSYYDITKSEDAPSLAELTDAAITALDGNRNGFFLMVEGSAVDGGGHSSDTVNMVSEFIAFDEACKVAIEFAKTRNDTVVVIAPDHDTGGMTYETNSAFKSVVAEVRSGINPGSIVWEGKGGHTARDGGVFMYLPEGVSYPDGIDADKIPEVAKTFSADFRECTVNRINNTDIAPYLADLLGADLKEASKKLFVDVTDAGEYNADTAVFTFTNKEGAEISIKRNTSTAEANGKIVDLGGQVAVFLGDSFYVPMDLYEYKEPQNITFSDVMTDDWFFEDVEFAVSNGLFSGTEENKFSPNGHLTRAMLVTVLYRIEGEPEVNKDTIQFADIKEGSYYENAVLWAKENGITGGITESEFAPDLSISREQIASIMYRYADYKKYDTKYGENTNLLSYNDFADISEYAIPAMQYAVESGLMKGKTNTALNPKNFATRAEAAAIIHRFIELNL